MFGTRQKIYTYADYEKLPEGAPYQLIEGELVMSPAPIPSHQITLQNISDTLGPFVRKNKLGKVIVSPIDVYLSDTDTFQPDIIFLSNERLSRIGEKRIEGAPDLVIEILSPSTGYYDLTHKKRMYEVSGVLEFWSVDYSERAIEVFENSNGEFQLIAKTRERGIIQSKLLPGFTIETADVFEM